MTVTVAEGSRYKATAKCAFTFPSFIDEIGGLNSACVLVFFIDKKELIENLAKFDFLW